MARTMLYHRTEFPLGRVFDTETNKPDPYIGTAPFGSVDSPAKLNMTQDDLIEAIVRKEFAAQSQDRPKIDKEYEKATGDTPHFAAKEGTLIKTLDDPKALRRAERKRKAA